MRFFCAQEAYLQFDGDVEPYSTAIMEARLELGGIPQMLVSTLKNIQTRPFHLQLAEAYSYDANAKVDY